MRFSWKTYLAVAVLLGGFWGCQKISAPVAPLRSTVLSVSVPIPSSQRTFLLGTTSNEILYNLSAPGSTPVTGLVGPFSTSGVGGTVDFSLNPSSITSNSVLAIQLNDATTHTPLAIGAAALGFSGASGGVSVDLGSVIRNCYSVSNFLAVGGAYCFDANAVNGAVTDVSISTSGPGYQFRSSLPAIAFMGNGQLVNFAFVPASSSFQTASNTLTAGDVYCIALATGGHAWVQIVNGGSAGVTGPSFLFRSNRTLPYFAYDPTTCDNLGRTPTMTYTPTPVSTNTPTSSPTITPSFTITSTQTSTPTATATVISFDITGNINGSPVTGTTNGQLDLHSATIGTDTWGSGAPDKVYRFILGSPKQLYFNLCNASFDTVLYLCTDPTNPSTTLVDLADDSQFCGGGSLQTILITGVLQPGTYYLVVDGFQPGDVGPFVLTASTFNPTSVLSGLPAPVTATEPDNDDSYFTQANNLGSLNPGGQLDGVGEVKYYRDEVDTWGVTVTTDATLVTLSLDSFDDGTGKNRVALDLYDSGNNLVDSSAGNTPLDQITDTLPAGNYHIAVYSITDGSDGKYRLALRAGGAIATITPTPSNTPTATATSTPPTNGSDITSFINNGLVNGDTSTSADNHSAYYMGSYGSGAYDVAYSFTVTQPQGQRFFIDVNTTYPNYYPILYVLTNPTDPTSVIAMNACTSNPYRVTLSTRTLAPGTYTVVVDGSYTSSYYTGPFTLAISTYNGNCALSPLSTPNSAVTPGADNTNYSDAGYIGSVNIGTDLTAKGSVQAGMMWHNLWAFTVQNSGFYTTSIDCFDDGRDKNPIGFDFYQSLGPGSVTFLDSSGFDGYPYYDSPYGPPPEPNQTSDWLSAGVTYFVDVVADECWTNGDYRMVIQGISGGTPTATPTDTVTQTPTITLSPTNTPTPVAASSNITSFIDSGKAITGDTTFSEIGSYSVTDLNNYVYGSGAPDTAFHFTLAVPKRLYFNLSTSGSFYYPILYVLGPGGVLKDLNSCGSNYQATLTTGILQPGTYTVVVDSLYSYLGGGPFSLTVSTFNPTCALSPTSTPNPSVTPGVDDTYFTDAGNLGTVAPASDLVGKGQLKYSLGDTNAWKFHVSAAGEYAISADCYDDGGGKAQIALDLYKPDGMGGFSLLDVTPDTAYPNQVSDWLLPGDYYVAAYANTCGSDSDYHLVIQGNMGPTATPEAATDVTTFIGGVTYISGDTTGQPDSHSYTDIEGNSWGHGSPDVVYRFTLNQPQQLDMVIADGPGNNGTMIAYLRTKQDDPSTTLSLVSGSCNCGKKKPNNPPALSYFIGSQHLITPLLPAGTYYLIVDGSSSSDQGAFYLSMNTFIPQCGYIGNAAPVEAAQPNLPGSAAPTPSLADDLGTVSSGTTAVGVGAVEFYVGAKHLWHFTAGSDGALYNISLDCFDNGQNLDSVGFDLYGKNVDNVLVPIDSSSDISYPNGTSDVLPAGDYYVMVSSNNNGSDGEYRLVVQGGNLPTPTFTPTITPTPVTPSTFWSAPNNGHNVGGVAVNSAGTSVYLSYNFKYSVTYDSSIQIWTGSGSGSTYSAPTTFTVSGGCPQALTTDVTGNLYVADSCSGYGGEKYNSAGSLLLYIGPYNSYGYAFAGYLYGVTGVAVAGTTVFMGENTTSPTVQSFGTGGGYINSWNGSGSDPAVAVNAAGTTIYVASYANTINLYSPSGSSLGTMGSDAGSFSPAGLAMASGGPYAGYLYVTDNANNQVLKFDTTGAFAGQWGSYGSVPGEFNNPSGIAVDGSGYIYVGDWGDGRVQVFSPR